MSEILKAENQAIFEAGKQSVQVLPAQDDRHESVIVHPQESRVSVFPAQKTERPPFLVARPTFFEVAAFIAYVNDFKDRCTRIFMDVQEHRFVAVLDHHEWPGRIEADGADQPQGMYLAAPRHGDHIATFQARHSEEWEAWIDRSEKVMTQLEMAEFIEDNSVDVVRPDATEMMQVALHLHATNNVTFRSGFNQANGQANLQYDEEIQGTVQGGKLEIPTDFEIGLRPFEGCHRYPVECRFRYRLNGGSLKMWFKALRPKQVADDAFEGIVARVRDETGIVPASGVYSP